MTRNSYASPSRNRVAALAIFCCCTFLFSAENASGQHQAASQDAQLRRAVGDSANETDRQGNVIRAMTFNIRFNNPRDGENAWPHRKDHVAGIIQDNADVVGLQEALAEQVGDLETCLEDFAWYGVGRNDGKSPGDRNSGETCAIFYRKDRFEKLNAGTFWLSEDPQQVGGKSWDAALPRICSWVELKDVEAGETFFAFNTHFDHVGETARRKSAALLLTELARIAGDRPFFLTGDFNAAPNSQPYSILTGATGEADTATFRDAYRVSIADPQGPDSTWNGFREVAPGRRIDYVFLPAELGEVRTVRTIDETFEGRFPSDHLPVVAEIVFQR